MSEGRRDFSTRKNGVTDLFFLLVGLLANRKKRLVSSRVVGKLEILRSVYSSHTPGVVEISPQLAARAWVESRHVVFAGRAATVCG